MELTKINKKKIFVTGYSGCGKTTFAKEYSNKFNTQYIDFDDNWVYGDSVNSYNRIVKKYPDEFITDAIPFGNVDDKFLFSDYYNKNKEDIKIVCVICGDLDELYKRRPEKDHQKTYEEYYAFYHDTLSFFTTIFPDVEFEYYDTFTNEYLTRESLILKARHALRRTFKSYLDSLPYDKYYQAIECINYPGYTDSVRTWNNIKNLVDWKGKKVADLGCFHAYFGFKAAQEGAKVTGLDLHPIIIKTASILNFIEGKRLKFQQWEGGQEVSADYDIVLALNVIHHFKDLKLSLENIKAKTVIFEVNQEEVEPISEVFNIIQRVNSHRHSIKGVDRIILLCEKK